jgi:GTP-binding protein LepA
VFDSHFDAFKGVVAYVRVIEGTVQTNDSILFKASWGKTLAKEVGHFSPKEVADGTLRAGQIGYVASGLKEADLVRIGDTITHTQTAQVEALAGYNPSKPVVFVSFFPQDQNNFDELKDAIWKLKLSDPALEYEPESHEALGRGFRCGFLGVLHSEIISERLQREYQVPLVISRPSVEFQVIDTKGKKISVKTAADWPQEHLVQAVQEPWVWLELVMPNEYYSQVVQLLAQLEGQQLETNNLSENTLSVLFETPLREIVIDFYDKLKSATQGMASMDYQITDWREAHLVKLEIHIAGQKEEAFSQVVSKDRAYKEGSSIVKKLKDLLPQQQFPVAIQAVVGGDVIARETLKASRRDVTGYLYGGDVTRKNKLLDKQKKGKKELAAKGRVRIPSKVFLDVFRT